VAAVADPWAGSFFMERLTSQMEEGAEAREGHPESEDADDSAASAADEAPAAAGGGRAALGAAGSERRLEIPIFLFSVDLPFPVFVDKYFQARP
jgi:hypothetical protein